ncbi:hypothetical protein ABZ897_19770 [Nonomuraea sp. NPDC046802]|uniref:hypothetical protein n=1 Tax=Nonomuraea sp. NPDC046802 TaxID=3154919 RepID=UPI0033D1F118
MFEPSPGDRFALDLADLPKHAGHDDHGLLRTAQARVSGPASIRTSLIHRKIARNFGTHPDADEPGPSILHRGETPADVDPGPAAGHGYHFTHLNQLALEHLLGVRG